MIIGSDSKQKLIFKSSPVFFGLKGLYFYVVDQLHGYCAADLHLCFHIYAKSRFSHDMVHAMHVR